MLDGPAYPGGTASLVAPVRDANGTPLVLKLQWPHAECEHEADALAAWGGRGAVGLVAVDRAETAILMHRCDPGTPLAARPHDEVLDVLIALVPKLWVDVGAGPFPTQGAAVDGWAREIEQARPRLEPLVGADLLDRVPAIAGPLMQPCGDQVLSHQDLHPGNVVADERAGWLAIDPKPIVGDRECGVIAIVRSTLLGFAPADVRARLDRLAVELDLDRRRMRDLALLQVMAWSADDGPNLERHMRSARTLAQVDP